MGIAGLWVIFAIVLGIGASARGRSGFGWFILAMLISPLAAFVLLVLLPSLKPGDAPPRPSTHVKCPDCAELILNDARVCKHCGCRLTPQSAIKAPASPLDDLR